MIECCVAVCGSKRGLAEMPTGRAMFDTSVPSKIVCFLQVSESAMAGVDAAFF
jgi:hypothetical protein